MVEGIGSDPLAILINLSKYILEKGGFNSSLIAFANLVISSPLSDLLTSG